LPPSPGRLEIKDIKKEFQMPLPIGHTALGWAAYETAQGSTSRDTRPTFRSSVMPIAFVTVLANLPDLDVLFGLIFYGNGSAIHRGPTHSLLFALLAGFLASKLWRIWRHIPRFGFGLCFMIIFSHIIADMLLTTAPVSMLWPLEIYFSQGHNGWGQIVHMVLFQSVRDAGLVLACLIYVNALRLLRRRAPVFPLFAFAGKRVKQGE
jgi:membrane-bound metal-dependent hydrolase YbcI (DUF457 family)